jgi:ubiquinone/menaquinone biosynthesis C-methylase UbiE
MAEQSVAFDRAADYYDQTRGYPPGEERAVASIIAQAGSFNKSSRILEIGVGTGRIALPVSAYTGAYYGIDISRPMMARLKAKQNGEAVYITEADATQLPFGDDSFDGAVAVHVFHLIPGWQKALAELKRVLRPGAMLVHCWSKDDDDQFKPLWEAWNTALGEKANATYGVPWRTQPNYLEDEGWIPVRKAVTHTYTIETSVHKFLEQIRGRMWSACWRYTDEEVDNGLSAIEAVLPTTFPDAHQPISRVNTVYARGFLPPV